ncbi:DUF4231 domain-containing protein [Solwaraspora sp. WMMA2080]|uniref:DUF4231 domain-containing protein n=1 Tax=unclassified Solwaraspora TaxID=2627926 RepID=UPI00248C51C3|nr:MULTISPECIES: DUF4231 domain-containing protein [unclassified Solwaraspora]WBB95205.1 DUF4231 domain-containing protein [Solwaraspora sp. WMMA2059]WBC20889.1 DUF4231 domain-containing protein [Solwaraspora sp. WMMA2080]
MTTPHDGTQGQSPDLESQRVGIESQDRYRAIGRDYELAIDRLRAAKSAQITYSIVLLSAFTLAALLAYSVAIGLWRDQPVVTRYVGLTALLILCVSMGRLAIKNRRNIVELDFNVRNLNHDRQSAAARIPSDSIESLRIYREASQDIVAQFRTRATRNLRTHNTVQAIIIVGSIAASTTTAVMAGEHPLSWFSTGLTAFVSITAGLAAYFKFRERGYNLQSTADDIEKHYNAIQFRLHEYAEVAHDTQSGEPAEEAAEATRLRLFAENVERLREEQRKRELQLEQSPGQREER